MFDSWQSWVALAVAILIAYGVVLWLGIIVWTYRDIRERTRDGWSQTVAVLLVAIFNIPGLFLYLILRPHETLSEAYERRMEAELLMRDAPERPPSCPECRRTVREEFLICPYCRANLREPCLGCGRALELAWIACPHCGAQGPQSAQPTSVVAAAAGPATAGGPPPEAPAPPPSEPVELPAEASRAARERGTATG